MDLILEIAKKNGYNRNVIENRIKKKLRQASRQELSTLFQEVNAELRQWITLNYLGWTQNIKRRLHKRGFLVTSTSRRYLLRTRLQSVADKKSVTEKIGIYKISCPDGDKIYVGQTKQLVHTRVLEHLKEAESAKNKNNPGIRSAVARHIIEQRHHLSLDNANILKNVNDVRSIAWQSPAFFVIIHVVLLIAFVPCGENSSPLYRYQMLKTCVSINILYKITLGMGFMFRV